MATVMTYGERDAVGLSSNLRQLVPGGAHVSTDSGSSSSRLNKTGKAHGKCLQARLTVSVRAQNSGPALTGPTIVPPFYPAVMDRGLAKGGDA